jgi:uncharacterized tellurite resistance protein B-like protein
MGISRGIRKLIGINDQEEIVSKSNVIMALAKVMIATAWADGSITNDEINSLKDLLFQLPEMTASDWAELDIYIETPVGEAERARLVADLGAALSSSHEKAMAVTMIDELVNADGEITAEERETAEEIKTAIQEANVGVLGGMSKFLGNSVNRRSQAVERAPNRELYLDDYVKNKVFYNVSRRLELEQTEIDISERELRRLSLAGGLMARVAYVDHEVQEGEFNSMVEAIQTNWELSDVEAALVAESAVSAITKGLDYYRMSRRFFESTTEDERVHFMDALFAVADADGRVSYEEIEEIRTIATVLKLHHKQFIDAKLKIPRERRAN